MKVAYLLETTGLSGGAKVVFQQAEALRNRSHHASVFCREPYPTWYGRGIPFIQRDPLESRDRLLDFDWIIATSLQQVLHLYEHTDIRTRLCHLTQGYEGEMIEGRSYYPFIWKAYSLPIPKLAVSEHLCAKLRQIYPTGRFTNIGQGIDRTHFYHEPTYSPDSVEKLFLFGPLSISVKQIPTGLRAAALAREKRSFQVARISAVDTRKEEEQIFQNKIDAYHVHLNPREVGDILRAGGGILFSPSSPEEGFGLPAIEAMACGVPTVLTDIPSYRSFSPGHTDYTVFVPHDDAEAMSLGILSLMGDAEKRAGIVERGLEISSRFSFDEVARKIEAALL